MRSVKLCFIPIRIYEQNFMLKHSMLAYFHYIVKFLIRSMTINKTKKCILSYLKILWKSLAYEITRHDRLQADGRLMLIVSGKVNSIFGVCESIVPLFYGPMYSFVYKATLETFPGMFFLVGSVLTAPAALIFLLV